jgi:GAF domain-containing protein
MALGSIDATTMLPRTVEAAQLQGREQSQLQHAADQPAIQFQQKTEQEARQTVESQKSETDEYDMDGEGKRRDARANKRKKKEKEAKENPVAPRSNSSFDVTI